MEQRMAVERFPMAVLATILVLIQPAGLLAQDAAPPRVAAPDPAAEAPLPPICPDPAAPPAPAQPETVILPTTGLTFSLPPAEDDEATPPPCVEPARPVRPPAPNIFGTRAVPIGAGLMAAKWNMVQEDIPASANPRLATLLGQARDLPAAARLDMVNRWVNTHVRFAEDADGDSWSPLSETLRRGSGDCEDYAIAKYAILRELGFSGDDLFLVLLRERHRPRDHAVLAVRLDNALQVLDNRTDAVMPEYRIDDYQPTFSFAGPFAWVHGHLSGQGAPSATFRLSDR